MDDWDDLRHFLAVADTGSTLAAGRRLRVSQTTCARRVAALEARLGLRLFDRRQAGYILTADGEALVASAQAAAAAVEEFAAAAQERARAARGVVRVTAPEIYAVSFLSAMLRDFHAAHPEIGIELDTSDSVRDLATGAADVAIRIATTPRGSGGVGRSIADDVWALYCSRRYAEEHGVPRNVDELRRHAIIGGGEEGVWRAYGQYIAAHGLERSIVMQHSSSLGLLSAVRAGMGISALPSLVAAREPDLMPCLRTAPTTRGMWLLIHERSRNEARVRTVVDFLHAGLTGLARHDDAGQPISPPT